tara:strand:+ start:179 stop:580 length:402 start_codon:yes stop_codon:yes gene_type:complete
MKNRKFKIYKNITGTLIPFSIKKDIPFKVKRIFLINGKKNSFRADHAHFKCSQYLVSIEGSVKVFYENKNKKFITTLSLTNKKGLLLKPKTWCRIKFNKKNSKLLVFCDREYEYFDYIEHYDEFLKIIKKQKR